MWVVSGWTEGGNVADATVRLVTTPSSVSGDFNFGCGSHDGSASCDLGEVDATSAQRELEAQVVVPATDTSVTSVQLKVIGSAAHLPTDPHAAVSIAVKSASSGGGTGGTGGNGGNGTSNTPVPSSSPLPVGSLPFVNGGSTSSLSPGGNAGGLFPTITPSSGSGTSGQRANARTIANTSALPLGAPVVGAQLIGLGVLALAFVLAVTRLSIRRRPVAAGAAPASAARTGAAGTAPAGGTGRASGGNKPADSSKPADGLAARDSLAAGDGPAADAGKPDDGEILEN